MRRVALLALLAVAASACTIDIEVGISLMESGSGTVTVDVTADEEFHSLYRLTGGDFEDLIARRGDEVGLAFEVTPGSDTHYSAASSDVSASTLTGILEGLAPGIGDITISATETQLTFDGELDSLTSIDDVAVYFENVDPGQFADDVTVTVDMTVPGNISSSTGTSTTDGRLRWSIPFSDSDTRVLASSVLAEEGGPVPWSTLAIVGTLVIAFGFLIAVRSRFTPEEDGATSPRPIPQARNTAPEDQPVALDERPPEDQPVEPPSGPLSN